MLDEWLNFPRRSVHEAIHAMPFLSSQVKFPHGLQRLGTAAHDRGAKNLLDYEPQRQKFKLLSRNQYPYQIDKHPHQALPALVRLPIALPEILR